MCVCVPPPPANYRAGSYSFIITSPTLAGERMLLIPKVSILSEQIGYFISMLTRESHGENFIVKFLPKEKDLN